MNTQERLNQEIKHNTELLIILLDLLDLPVVSTYLSTTEKGAALNEKALNIITKMKIDILKEREARNFIQQTGVVL